MTMENFRGALLSSWNSVFGPKISHMWLLNDHALFYLPMKHCVNIKYFEMMKERYSFIPFKVKETINIDDDQSLNFPSLIENIGFTIKDFRKYLRMSGKLLLTEMETKRPFIENCSRLYQLEDKIMFSIIFCKQIDTPVQSTDLETSCLCLSLIFGSNNFTYILKMQNILDLHLRHIVSAIQKSPDETFKSKDILDKFKHLCEAVEVCTAETKHLNEAEYLPRFSQFQLRVKFLSRAIVSHMQTSGHSIVIGASQFTVYQVASVLLLFNNTKEKHRSAPVIKSFQGTCYRGLQVQGLVRDYSEYPRLELPEEYYNNCPITIIDTDSYKVRQSLPDEFHQKNSKSLKTVTESGKLIPRFLQDMFQFEENKLPTRSFLNSLRRCINIKAVALIKLSEKFRESHSAPTEKQLMTLMDVADTVDFKIYVGFAEKLKPGIRTCIL